MTVLEITHLDRSCTEEKVVLPPDVRTIRIHLTNGSYVEVELFEREGLEGKIQIRGQNTLILNPWASNVVVIGSEKKVKLCSGS